MSSNIVQTQLIFKKNTRFHVLLNERHTIFLKRFFALKQSKQSLYRLIERWSIQIKLSSFIQEKFALALSKIGI